MVFPVHLQRAAVVAIVDCPDRGQFIGSPSLKQPALQSIWFFQEPRLMAHQVCACIYTWHRSGALWEESRNIWWLEMADSLAAV